MERRQWMGLALAATFAVMAGCSDDDGLGPGDQELSQQEVGDIAELTADAIDGILDGEMQARPLVVADGAEVGGGLALSMAPVTTTFEWSRQRECRNGGFVAAEGEGTHVADRETGEVTIDFSGTKTIDDCARARGDLVIVINGSGIFAGHRYKVDGQFVGPQTFDAEGSFTWETSDGRSGSCEYEIHVVWDPDTHTKTITGFICDREIDRTLTRDGSAGNDGQDG